MRYYFDGATYREEFDYERLKSGVQKTLWVLLDGKWHETLELRSRVGQDAVDTRVRDLRKEWCGSLQIEMERNPRTKLARYQLLLDSVDPHWVQKILEGKVKAPKREPLTKDPEELRELLVASIDTLLTFDDIKHAQNAYLSMRKKILAYRGLEREEEPEPEDETYDITKILEDL